MIRSQYFTGVAIALGLSTAVVVAAQTVPAEEWVGQPIQFTSTLSRAEVQAAYIASAQTAQAPQELRVGPADPGVGMVERAMVEADRNLYLRAGLGDVGEFDDSVSPTYKERQAAYERMRNGPEFAMELARINRGASTAALAQVSE
ncbi:hypothetical protein QTH91_19650 [Variovorax dokdonensis]|uniref:DUF4148 domain-containing protein n=1 Tax=Variovorax dokdonensis TaxID=344883 RepID=A0ABT7NFW6_9BURK|nr:hypothetical protein [Variovorax dokdonensis]MDM0046715.1 hypothetical protein [Variovorax dokdonensis]